MPPKRNGPEIFNKIMDAAMNIPGIRIDRAEFLAKELKPYVPQAMVKKAIEGSTQSAGISTEVLDKIALGVLRYHVMMATGISFLDGLPGGWWMAATLPTDVGQFYYNVVQLAQKLAYVYGWPDFGNRLSTDDFKAVITVFMAIMMGNAAAAKGIKQLADLLAEGIAKKLPKIPLSRYGFYNLAKQLAKWIGITVTKDSFAKGVSKIIPVLGGIFSGGLTLVLMLQMGNRLILHLKDHPFPPYIGDVIPL